MKLGLREANQHFSQAVKAVRAGKEVILEDHLALLIRRRSGCGLSALPHQVVAGA